MSIPPTSPKHRRGRTLGLAAAGVLVVAALGGGGLAYGVAQAQGPISAAKAYCADLQAQDYTAAYGLLSAAYQSRVAQTDFVADAKLHDQVDGKVVDCGQPHSGTFTWNLETSGKQSLETHITRENTTGVHDGAGTITLLKQGTTWKVDAIADVLQGTDLGAYRVSQMFCTNFLAGNYAAAYQLFSAKGQQNYGSEQQFETAFMGTFSNGLSLAQCQPDITTYTVTSPAAQIKVKLSVSDTTAAGTDTFSLPGGATLTFTRQNGTWKVDELDVNIANT